MALIIENEQHLLDEIQDLLDLDTDNAILGMWTVQNMGVLFVEVSGRKFVIEIEEVGTYSQAKNL
jgi:hypothetical protein